MSDVIQPPVIRKKMFCLIVTGLNEAALQIAVNGAMADIFNDSALYEIIDVKLSGLTAMVLYCQITTPVNDL